MGVGIMNLKKLLLSMAVVLTVSSALGATWFFRETDDMVRLPGLVEIQEVRLSSKIGGRVREVFASEGDIVSPGQALVVFDVPEWHAKRNQIVAQLRSAEAQFDQARNGPLPEEKAAAKASWEMAKARLARLKNGPRPEEIDAARKEWDALKADEERARKDWDREASLNRKRASTSAQMDLAFAVFSKIQNQAKAASERWRLLSNGTREEDIAEAEAEVAKSRAHFELLVRGTRSELIADSEARVLEMKARVQEIEAMLAESTVVAPKRALVEVVSVRPGDTVIANQPVVRVLYAEDLWVKAYITEPDLGHIAVGQEVAVTNDTFPNRKCLGNVTYIAAASEFTPRNVQSPDERRNQVFAIKVRLVESAETFRSGMAVEVHVRRTHEPHP